MTPADTQPPSLNPALAPSACLAPCTTGIASLALVPVVLGPSSLTAPAPAHADLYGGLPDLPFPLELVAGQGHRADGIGDAHLCEANGRCSGAGACLPAVG